MTRKALAQQAAVSERHLASMEYGVGNASALVLLQVAQALHCSLAELVGDFTTSSPEWLMIRELLQTQDEATLQRVRFAIGEMLGKGGSAAGRSTRIALIGAGRWRDCSSLTSAVVATVWQAGSVAQLALGAGCDAGWGQGELLMCPMADVYLHAFRQPGFRRCGRRWRPRERAGAIR